MKIGILGLGRIGRAVAGHLHEAGFAAATVDRSSAHDFEGVRHPDAAALAASCDVVISALATEALTEQAFLAPDGLVSGAHDGLIVIEMGTFPVALKRRLIESGRSEDESASIYELLRRDAPQIRSRP